jgi:protocatechuate 3,4-dioxygenase beta subunit
MAPHHREDRRRFLLSGAAAAAGLTLAGPGPAGAQTLPATPECTDGDKPTLRQSEGPFYTPKSPQRWDLVEAGMKGPVITVSGRVMTRSCRPVAGALVDVWQADADGEYDNEGFRLRGHVFTDAEGRYRFRTVVPASYPGRTRHIHVKVQAPKQRVLTTQLYFPNDPANRRDRMFRRELLLRISESGGERHGQFDFVLNMA